MYKSLCVFFICFFFICCNKQESEHEDFYYRGEKYFSELDSANIDEYYYGRRCNPARDYVPNAKIAVEIARPVLNHIYGEDDINKQKPFNVYLINNKVWHIEGSLNPPSKYYKGGVFIIRIKMKDGKILSIGHEK